MQKYGKPQLKHFLYVYRYQASLHNLESTDMFSISTETYRGSFNYVYLRQRDLDLIRSSTYFADYYTMLVSRVFMNLQINMSISIIGLKVIVICTYKSKSLTKNVLTTLIILQQTSFYFLMSGKPENRVLWSICASVTWNGLLYNICRKGKLEFGFYSKRLLKFPHSRSCR